MKFLLLLFVSIQFAYADIPEGKYLLNKIVCTTGKVIKLDSKEKFVGYKVYLTVKDLAMTMTAKARSKGWASFILNCDQRNKGKFSYVGDDQFEGYLSLDKVKCNVKMWTGIVKKRKFGVHEQGLANYKVNGKKLIITHFESENRYSCADEGGIPQYYYTKVN